MDYRAVHLNGVRPGTSGRTSVRSRRAAAWLFVCLAAILLSAGTARAQTSREYQLKAAFLYNFAQFTEWPTNAFSSTNAPVVIGVLGTDPFGSTLEEVVRNEQVHGRPLTVRRYSEVEEIGTCHVLFIGRSENRRLDSILEALRGRPVLTVSDLEGSAREGVMIQLITEGNRIRFRVNLPAVQSAGVTLSSRLLRVAEVIGRN